MQHLHHVDTIEEMRLMAVDIVSHYPKYTIVLLRGELGAGKTTLAQMICEILGVEEQVTSPTYTLVNEYNTKVDHIIYHFDLYRLQKEEELEGIGFTEYIDSGNICLIEWPEIATKYLKDLPQIEVIIHKQDEGRKIELNFYPLTVD
jgi:tRNA threonylcarbamoyladenosine biosynthesis protein TsaE